MVYLLLTAFNYIIIPFRKCNTTYPDLQAQPCSFTYLNIIKRNCDKNILCLPTATIILYVKTYFRLFYNEQFHGPKAEDLMLNNYVTNISWYFYPIGCGYTGYTMFNCDMTENQHCLMLLLHSEITVDPIIGVKVEIKFNLYLLHPKMNLCIFLTSMKTIQDCQIPLLFIKCNKDPKLGVKDDYSNTLHPNVALHMLYRTMQVECTKYIFELLGTLLNIERHITKSMYFRPIIQMI